MLNKVEYASEAKIFGSQNDAGAGTYCRWLPLDGVVSVSSVVL